MAKTLDNFKTAMNELMNGKIETNSDDNDFVSSNENYDYNDYNEPISTSVYSNEGEAAMVVDEPASTAEIPPAYRPTVSSGSPIMERESVFTSDMVIEGNVRSKSNIRVNGFVKGNMSCEGNIVSNGKIDGNVKSLSLTVSQGFVSGNVTARERVLLDKASVVTGDIQAASLSVNGKIKGNVSVSGDSVFMEDSIIVGNIFAQSIAVERGASVRGYLDVKTQDVNDDDFDMHSVFRDEEEL